MCASSPPSFQHKIRSRRRRPRENEEEGARSGGGGSSSRSPAIRACLSLLFILARPAGAEPQFSRLRASHPIELSIESGSVRGEQLSIRGNDFAVFKGIPYAAPPVGSLRFQAPEAPARWRGVMNATQYAAMCVQPVDGRAVDPVRHTPHFSEDCLYLNVYSLVQFTNDTLPVLVFVHGGDWQSGGSSDYPQSAILDNFVARQLVVVTFNYRLGPLGFASTGDSTMPGNMGLWDMLLALKWIQSNIVVFGGDPSQVVLMGAGAGAASVSLLALSPRSEGLFSSVVLLSGCALQPGAVRDSAVNATWALDKKLHCRSFNSSELLDCFRKQLKDEILDVVRTRWDDYEEFVPRVDGPDGVIPDTPLKMAAAASRRRLTPLLLGTTRDESALRLLMVNEKQLNWTTMTGVMAAQLADNLTLGWAGFKNGRLVADAAQHEYVWTKLDPSMPSSVLRNSVLKMYSHFWYDAPTVHLSTIYDRAGAPVFLFSFDHVSDNFYDYDRAWHGVPLLHLFNVTPRYLTRRKDGRSAPLSENTSGGGGNSGNWQLDQRVTDLFADMVANFARRSNPTPPESGLAFNWTRMSESQLNFLSVTDAPQMEVGYRWQANIFWNWYVAQLEQVDVGNLHRIAQLDKQLGDYQLATWMLLFCALFFFAILVGLACYCTRKDSDSDEL